jgi:hypothetical protein
LGQDDPPHRLAVGHAERLGGLELAWVDGDDAGPDDLGHVGALVDAEGEDARLDRTGDGDERQRQVRPDPDLGHR